MNTKTTIQIRPAMITDLDAMCDLADQINAQHHAAAPRIFVQKPNRELDRQFWHGTFENPVGCALLAYDGEQVLGFITMSWHENVTIPFCTVVVSAA